METKIKPCRVLKYCPYGSLVELSRLKKERDEESCGIFGHDCPVFKNAESWVDEEES